MAASNPTAQGVLLPGTGTTGYPTGVPIVTGPPREVNTASLCRIGQDTMQDIVTRTTEVFQILRGMQLPNGGSYSVAVHTERQAKLQEHLRQLTVLFRKLRLVFDKCREKAGPGEPEVPLLHIPFVDEEGTKQEEKTNPALLSANEERHELIEKLRQKNQQLKQVIDMLRNLIWDINLMMSARS
uniref:mediator of RNA polymerase II transcription subunit 30-like isoform X2 n=1 Tax=Myxine glutinosa TaxID=7769 RepID=UPI00358E0C28